mgnify:CR=1 FL=1
MFKKSDNEVHGMSTAVASEYVRRMVARESRGPGDTEGAMARLEARYGIGFWQLSHLRGGRAKPVDIRLFARIRAAYLDYCEKQIRLLQHEIAVEKAINEDDSLEDLEREAEELVARVAAKRKAVSA